MVRDVFRLAKENSPAIIFIDEIDAIATKRFDAQTGADREVQRILLELLNQMDGFDQTTNVKVIMATNRADTLDPALLRPGRLDRKIEFPLPDRRQKRLVFSTITSKMNLSEEVDLEDYVARPDRISGADINAICQEVGTNVNTEFICEFCLVRYSAYCSLYFCKCQMVNFHYMAMLLRKCL
jgi:26S proteasome regulatory subunit T3